jgi:cell division septal protein FtsQ
MAQRRPQQRPRARAAVIPLPAGDSRALLRLLPTGGSLLAGFALLAAAAGLYLLARETPMFALRKIEVEGAPPAVAARVRHALSPLEGRTLLALDGADVERRLGAIPDVAASTYDRDFPHTLRVTIRPEHPVAIARRGAQAWLVAASARTIAKVSLHARPRLPRIWLAHSGDPAVGSAITDPFALRAVRVLAGARLAQFKGRIRMVRSREHELTLLLGSGLQLRLGELRAIRLKLAVAARLLPLVYAHGGYLYLDVSVPDRPVAGTTLDPKVEP